MDDFAKRLSDIEKQGITEEFSLFGGTFSSLKHAHAEFALEAFYYEQAIRNEQYMKKALEEDKLTETEIASIAIEGKYVKKFVKPDEEKIEYAG